MSNFEIIDLEIKNINKKLKSLEEKLDYIKNQNQELLVKQSVTLNTQSDKKNNILLKPKLDMKSLFEKLEKLINLVNQDIVNRLIEIKKITYG